MRGERLVAALLAAAVLASMALAKSGSMAPGDAVTSQLADGESDRLSIYVPYATGLDVRASAPKGMVLRLAVEAPGGAAVDLTGSLRGSPGRRPAIHGLQVDTPGTYTVQVLATGGPGTYKLSTKLRRRKTARIDLGTATGGPGGVRLDAANVLFDAGSTTLEAETLQGACQELDAKLEETKTRVDAAEVGLGALQTRADDADAAIAGLDQRASDADAAIATATLRADAADSAVGALQASTQTLAGRVTTLEARPDLEGLKLVAAIASPTTIEGVEIDHPTTSGKASSIRRSQLLSVELDPKTAGQLIVVRVESRVYHRYNGKTTETAPLEHVVFAELGTKQLHATPQWVTVYAPVASDALGVQATSALPTEIACVDTLVFRPAEGDVVTGSKLKLYLSAYKSDGGDPGRTLVYVVQSAVVMAQ